MKETSLPLSHCIRGSLLLLSVVSLSACTPVVNVISGYKGQAQDMRDALCSNNPEIVQKEINNLEKKCESADKILYLCERGRMKSLSGDNAGSIEDYQIASDVFEEERMKAVISASETFFAAGSLVSNDMAIPYNGYGYEKVMLHNLQAINFLLEGKADYARIELNRADVEQSFALEQHQKLATEAESKRQSESIDLSASMEELKSKTSGDTFKEESIKNSFQNAFTFYLRGTLFEDEGALDKALIEYKRALDIFPANAAVAEDAMRMAKALQNEREQQAITQLHGALMEGSPAPTDAAHIVVIYEQGFVSVRSTLRIPFLWEGSILQVTLPYYDLSKYMPSSTLRVGTNGRTFLGSRVCNLDAMAVQALKEDYAAILLRQTLRLIAKHKLHKEMNNQNAFAGLAAQISNTLTDRADDRNWLTLPASMQVTDFFVPAGQQDLSFTYSGLSNSVTLDALAGHTHYIIVTQLGNMLVVQK